MEWDTYWTYMVQLYGLGIASYFLFQAFSNHLYKNKAKLTLFVCPNCKRNVSAENLHTHAKETE